MQRSLQFSKAKMNKVILKNNDSITFPSLALILAFLCTINGTGQAAPVNGLNKSAGKTKIAKPEAGSLIKQGEVLAKQKDWAGAKDFFLKAIALEKNNVVAYYDLGVALSHLNDWQKAIEAEEQALALDDKYVRAHAQLGWIYTKMGNPVKAQDSLNRALSVEPTKSAPVSDKAVSSTNAVPEIKTLVSNTVPEVQLGHIDLGQKYFGQGNTTEAINEFKKAVEESPNSALAHGNLGVALGQIGDLEGQIREEKEALRLEPKSERARINLAWALAGVGNWQDAHMYYSQALDLNSTLLEAKTGLGLARIHTGDIKGGISLLEATAKLYPNNKLVQEALKEAYEITGRKSENLVGAVKNLPIKRTKQAFNKPKHKVAILKRIDT